MTIKIASEMLGHKVVDVTALHKSFGLRLKMKDELSLSHIFHDGAAPAGFLELAKTYKLLVIENATFSSYERGHPSHGGLSPRFFTAGHNFMLEGKPREPLRHAHSLYVLPEGLKTALQRLDTHSLPDNIKDAIERMNEGGFSFTTEELNPLRLALNGMSKLTAQIAERLPPGMYHSQRWDAGGRVAVLASPDILHARPASRDKYDPVCRVSLRETAYSL